MKENWRFENPSGLLSSPGHLSEGASAGFPPFDLVYEIFPDRFAIGKGKTMAEKPGLGLYPEGATESTWLGPPPSGAHASPQHYGGDLFGVAEHADYLASLGVDAVYLTPIHSSPSYHRYDATDPRGVDPALGGMDGFEAMLLALHERGIRFILDLVLNHVSTKHPFFLRAQEDPSSSYRGYFRFQANGDYDCWRGYPGLPELNLENEAVLKEFITGEDSVLRFWITRGVDGFRLDCANDLGIAICQQVTRTAKACREDLYIVGETFHYSVDWLQGLDGVQSYVLTDSILDLLMKKIDGRQFGMNISRLHSGAQPFGGLHGSWNMLSSHDFQRVLTSLDGDIRRLELALLLQFTIPGIPMLYYGDEIGMVGGRDPLNRMPMVWNRELWNDEVRVLYDRMIALRRSRPELRGGDFHDLSEWSNNGTVGFLRTSCTDPRNFCLVFVNPTDERKRFPVYAPASRMFADMGMQDLLSGRTINTGSGALEIDLPPLSGAVYVPEYHIGHYNFSKRL